MTERGGGVIINQSSIASHRHGGAYGVSKLALNGLTVGLASEFAPDGIRVVGIAPGMVGSEAVLQRLEPHYQEQVLDTQMIKRFGTIEDLIGLVLFLCSPEASFITAQTYFVDGGSVPRY
jgi:NAD(P)-dependent dehydrogenase (short-subunit alcohol dehydrogenase family)